MNHAKNCQKWAWNCFFVWQYVLKTFSALVQRHSLLNIYYALDEDVKNTSAFSCVLFCFVLLCPIEGFFVCTSYSSRTPSSTVYWKHFALTAPTPLKFPMTFHGVKGLWSTNSCNYEQNQFGNISFFLV